MKKFLSLVLVSLFLTNTTFASFPVKNAEESEKTVVVNKTENATSSEVSSNNSTNVKSKKIEKIQSLMSKKGDNKQLIAIILGLLSVLLLPFAFHNWYLGKNKKALWQTLMVFPGIILLGLPAIASWIWQLIDLFIIIFKGV